MFRNKVLSLILLAALMCVTFHSAFAERVRRVYSDGIVEFETGQKVQIAGVRMAPEAVKILKILLADQDVQVERVNLRDHMNIGSASKPAYLYIRTKEIIYEENQLQKSAEKRQMVNELLLQMGAARVYQNTIPERKRSDFLKIEELARNSGAGIWSYNVSGKTNAVK